MSNGRKISMDPSYVESAQKKKHQYEVKEY
jgi:hypothetical protein